MLYRYYKRQAGNKVLVIGSNKVEIEKFRKQDKRDVYSPTRIITRKYNTFDIIVQ